MPTARAHIIRRTAPLRSEFGYSYAIRLFGEEAIDSLPRYQSAAEHAAWWRGFIAGLLLSLAAAAAGVFACFAFIIRSVP